MQITILTTGSLGDVRPYVALGVGLRRAGHRVRVATHDNFRDLIEGHGLEHSAVLGDARAFHAESAGRDMICHGDRPLRFMRAFARMRQPHADELLRQSWLACRDADLIVGSLTAVFEAQAAAEKSGVPLCLALLQPATPTAHFGSCLLGDVPPWLPGRRWLYSLSHPAAGAAFWWFQSEAINRARARVLGLPPLSLFGAPLSLLVQTPTVYGYSPRVLPRPADWPANVHVAGYWFLEEGDSWSPPRALSEFLADGPSPVVIGFGSMCADDACRLTRLAVGALERAGQRGILLTGWGGLGEARPSERVLVLDAAPHDWLMPRARAVVHHGGAGTAAACFRAGTPAVVVPFMADQDFWGRRACALGVAPQPIPRRRLTERALADAVARAAWDPLMRRRAAALAAAVRSEDGVARAVGVIERLARGTRRAAGAAPRWKQVLAACAARPALGRLKYAS